MGNPENKRIDGAQKSDRNALIYVFVSYMADYSNLSLFHQCGRQDSLKEFT